MQVVTKMKGCRAAPLEIAGVVVVPHVNYCWLTPLCNPPCWPPKLAVTTLESFHPLLLASRS